MKNTTPNNKFILFPAAFLPTHISTFAKSCPYKAVPYFAKELIFPLLNTALIENLSLKEK